MIDYMLPLQFGAITLDGSWLILLGILAVAGIVLKNRNNISVSVTDSLTNENRKLEENNVLISEVDENIETEELNKVHAKEPVEDLNVEAEKEKVFN